MWYNYSYHIWKLFPTKYEVKELGGFLRGWNNINPWNIKLDDDLHKKQKAKTKRHEEIHSVQFLDFVPFALIYLVVSILLGLGWWILLAIPVLFGTFIFSGISWVVNFIDPRQNGWNDYRDNVIEQEAWDNTDVTDYIKTRIPIWGWMRYFFKKKDSIK